MSVTFGEGDLGVITAGTRRRYQLTWEDLLWSARMLEGEAGVAQAAGNHGAAVLWCMASRFMAGSRASFKDLIMAYSQPINPIWRRDGARCRPGGSHVDRHECNVRALATRDRLKDKRWEEFSNGIQNMVFRWATAQVANPVSKAVHFNIHEPAVNSVRRQRNNPASEAARNGDGGWQFVWNSTGLTSIDEPGRGNTFLSTNNSRTWPAQHVKIILGDRIATDGSAVAQGPAEAGGSSTESPPLDQTGNTLTIPPNRIQNRTETITSNRTAPPNDSLPYLVVPTEYEDTQASRELSEAEEQELCFVNSTRFLDQVNSLKRRSNIQFTQVLPTIMILTESDDGGQIVNLNEEIFSASPFESHTSEDDVFPDRPIASIESWEVTIQQPSVGGVTGIQMGTLSIKIHNVETIVRDHPKGKYIAYMMQQGFVVRIRYGIEGGNSLNDSDAEEAFQWKEEDFFVSQYDVVLNLDKTMQLKVKLMPATHRLLNQLRVGQSLPVSSLGTVTAEEINRIVSNVTTGQEANEQQVSELRNRLTRFVDALQTPARSPGVGFIERGGGTFGLQLHAAISNREIFESDEALSSIPVSNMVEGIQGIQNILLTRRFQSLLQRDCYQYTFRGIARSVVNVGPLINNIVKPEVDYTFGLVTRNQIEIGEKFSVGATPAEPTVGNSRTNVVLIFGRFNAHAGTWANKPISSFPINTEAVFSHLRQMRSIGEFSSTINAFISMIAHNAREIENFDADTSQGAEEIRHRIQVPSIKYVIYPSPQNPNDWIMYVYDDKVPLVQIREAIDSISTATREGSAPTRDEVKRVLKENGIPWVELGEEGNFIKQISAQSEADDLLFSHNLLQSSRQSTTVRDMDDSVEWPAGISRDFMAATQMNAQSRIRTIQYVPPVRISLTSFCLATGYLFAPIFVFFPIRTFSGIYLVSQLRHDIKNGAAITNIDLSLNLSVYNLMAL